MDHARLLTLLRSSISRIIANDIEVAVAFSGGVDSSVLAALASEQSKVVCYTCAFEGSHDVNAARSGAEELSLDLVLVPLSIDGLAAAVKDAASLVGSADPVRIAYTVPVMRVIDESRQSCVLIGSGADELFAGYAKYATAANPERAMLADLDKMLDEARRLAMHAASKGKRTGFPFASEEVVSFARQLPIGRKLAGGERKVVLRDAARALGLASHSRPKKAAQYGSGVMAEMERAAKRRGKKLAEWVGEVTA